MLKSKLDQLKAKDGFTIIEVIIVLVIAAIIMLAVFLVVPQLQRTQRNSRRQNDARRVLAAAEQFAANNAGVFPPSATITGGACATPLTIANCPAIANITGQVNTPANAAYTVGNPANNDAGPGIGAMGLGASTLVGCANNRVGTGSSNFMVVVSLEIANNATQDWCVSSN